eukprot:1719987-Rhodomonas_salina.2
MYSALGIVLPASLSSTHLFSTALPSSFIPPRSLLCVSSFTDACRLLCPPADPPIPSVWSGKSGVRAALTLPLADVAVGGVAPAVVAAAPLLSSTASDSRSPSPPLPSPPAVGFTATACLVCGAAAAGA